MTNLDSPPWIIPGAGVILLTIVRVVQSYRVADVPVGGTGNDPRNTTYRWALRALRPHDDAGRSEGGFGITDGVFAEVEDRGGEHSIGVTLHDAFHQMLQVADTA